jgi:thioredoxin 1
MENKLEVLDFYGVWCNPCKVITPIINQLIDEYDNDNDIHIEKIDVDENKDMVQKYAIKSVPTILFIKNGEVVDRINGATSKKILKDKIDTYSMDI